MGKQSSLASFFGGDSQNSKGGKKEGGEGTGAKRRKVDDEIAKSETPKELVGTQPDISGNDRTIGVPKLMETGKNPIVSSQSECPWGDRKPVPYMVLATAFSKVEAITGRIEITSILSDTFRLILRHRQEDLLPAIYLSSNKLAPAHEGVEIGVGESLLIKALVQATGRTTAKLREEYKRTGDLGIVAETSKATQKTMFAPPPLTIRKVFNELKVIAGTGNQGQKTAKMQSLLVAAKDHEARYLARAMQGKLRIHLAEKTVIASLASAITAEFGCSETVESATARLNQVYNELPVWDKIVPRILEFEAVDERLSEVCKITAGVPVGPMLAKPTTAVTDVLDKFTEHSFTCEYKYDGERAQIHLLEDGSIKIYSRNAEDNTQKYPDIVAAVPKAVRPEKTRQSFVLDTEAVAFDLEKNEILPFQALQGRKKKDVRLEDVTVRVCLFAFDIIFCNGKSLLKMPLLERRAILAENFQEVPGEFKLASAHDGKDAEEITQFLEDSVKAGCEGLMVKALEGPMSTYEPANRSHNWLKVKKDYLEGMGDTLDLVPIGGYYGRGKRTGTFGGFLMACYDPDNEEYQTTCKLGTGFSDQNLSDFSAFYNSENRLLDKAKSYFRQPSASTKPDVWFEPSQVWEIKCADLSISPAHTAGIGLLDENKGIALRFPRFLRVRDDKGIEDATSAEQVCEMYRNQSVVKNNKASGD